MNQLLLSKGFLRNPATGLCAGTIETRKDPDNLRIVCRQTLRPIDLLPTFNPRPYGDETVRQRRDDSSGPSWQHFMEVCHADTRLAEYVYALYQHYLGNEQSLRDWAYVNHEFLDRMNRDRRDGFIEASQDACRTLQSVFSGGRYTISPEVLREAGFWPPERGMRILRSNAAPADNSPSYFMITCPCIQEVNPETIGRDTYWTPTLRLVELRRYAWIPGRQSRLPDVYWIGRCEGCRTVYWTTTADTGRSWIDGPYDAIYGGEYMGRVENLP